MVNEYDPDMEIEAQKDRKYDEEEDDNTPDNHYQDQLHDNLPHLKEDFIEANPDAFSSYCYIAYRESR